MLTEGEPITFTDGTHSLIDADGIITLELLPDRDGLTMERYFADDGEEGRVAVSPEGEPKRSNGFGKVIAEILQRWSVTDLFEMKAADLEHADELFYAKPNEMTVLAEGRNGVIKWWRLLSGGNVYEVRRFTAIGKNAETAFGFCSCPGFWRHRKPCKHIARTALVLCRNCRDGFARVDDLCYRCDSDAKNVLKPSRPVTFTMKGNL